MADKRSLVCHSSFIIHHSSFSVVLRPTFAQYVVVGDALQHQPAVQFLGEAFLDRPDYNTFTDLLLLTNERGPAGLLPNHLGVVRSAVDLRHGRHTERSADLAKLIEVEVVPVDTQIEGTELLAVVAEA